MPCGELDAEVEALRSRDLSRTPCCYLWLDATYMSCREGSVVSSHAVVTAIGLGADGRKHVLGVEERRAARIVAEITETYGLRKE